PLTAKGAIIFGLVLASLKCGAAMRTDSECTTKKKIDNVGHVKGGAIDRRLRFRTASWQPIDESRTRQKLVQELRHPNCAELRLALQNLLGLRVSGFYRGIIFGTNLRAFCLYITIENEQASKHRLSR